MEFITSEELAEKKKDDVLILDIRDDIKFRTNTVPGSINIDVYSDIKLGRYEIVKKKLVVLPKDKEIITVCNAGVIAQPASLILESMGYRTRVLENGMIGWNGIKSDAN